MGNSLATHIENAIVQGDLPALETLLYQKHDANEEEEDTEFPEPLMFAHYHDKANPLTDEQRQQIAEDQEQGLSLLLM